MYLFISQTVFTPIPVGFILGQAEKEGRQGGWTNGGLVHFIAGIKDEYNNIAFRDL